jgi:predicted small lipoprotein YifL
VALKERSILFKAVVAGSVLAALALSGCGRKGMPELPPSAAATTQDRSDTGEAPAAKQPDKPFPLDFLL